MIGVLACLQLFEYPTRFGGTSAAVPLE